VQLLSLSAEAAKPAKDDDKACEDCPDYSGWSGWVEGGIASQSKDDFHFGRYTGYDKSGATLILDGEGRYRGKDGSYVDILAVDLGLESRDLVVGGGKQGVYGVEFEYDQVPNFRKQLGSTTLTTERDRTGIKFTRVPQTNWEITGHYRHEQKDGTKDVGATFGMNVSQVQILPVAFKYQTDDFGLEMNYKGDKLQAQLAYAGSLFKNDQSSIPFSQTDVFGTHNGSIAESPDSESHQISGLMGYQLSDSTRLGAKLAFGHMTQNESFVPYTVNPGIATGLLPASSLDGKVDTTLASFDINSRPSPRLRLDASYTYSDRDNKTPVNSYSYVIADSANAPAAAMRTNRPYSFEQKLLRTKVGYKLLKDTDISAGFDYDQMNRTYQQAEETKDQTLWTKLRLHPTATVDTTEPLAKRPSAKYLT
jgi:MtrB/PioB family decaheme-associated outer membrane protein